MAIGTIGRKKVSTDPVTSPARAWLMLRAVGMAIPCLPVLQLWVLGQGVGNEGPCPCALGCLQLAVPFGPHFASCALGWPTVLEAELRLWVGLQPRFSGGSCRETSWKGRVWTPTKLPSCWLLEGWNFRLKRYRGNLLTLVVGLSLSWRSACWATGYQHADAPASPTLSFSRLWCLLSILVSALWLKSIFFSSASGAWSSSYHLVKDCEKAMWQWCREMELWGWDEDSSG